MVLRKEEEFSLFVFVLVSKWIVLEEVAFMDALRGCKTWRWPCAMMDLEIVSTSLIASRFQFFPFYNLSHVQGAFNQARMQIYEPHVMFV
jgi:hypothetical protein